MEVLRLRDGWAKPLYDGATVAFIGGSITMAGGPMDTACYRAQAMTALRSAAGELAEVNASIVGTGSELGAFRIGHDVLDHDPALVVVEFCVNDMSTPEDSVVLASMESLIRQCGDRNVVVVYSLAKDHLSDIAAGRLPRTVGLHEQVCDDYGIPSVWMGLPLGQAVLAGQHQWEDLFIDDVHPVAGHAHYATALLPALAQLNEASGARRPSPPIRYAGMTGATMSSFPAVLPDGWSLSEGDVLASPGVAPLAVPFEGVTVGVLGNVGPDSGHLNYRIDAGTWTTIRLFDQFSPNGYRPIPRVLARDLAPGPHVLHLRPSEAKDDRSTGHLTRLSSLLTATG